MGLIRAPIFFILGYIYISFLDTYVTPSNIQNIPFVGSFISRENVKQIRQNDGMHIVIFMSILALIL
jgi:hypothetical protein